MPKKTSKMRRNTDSEIHLTPRTSYDMPRKVLGSPRENREAQGPWLKAGVFSSEWDGRGN